MNKRELIFLNNIKADGKTYLFEHKTFAFTNGKKYTPDFYCAEDDKYIEVVGTRQAYHYNKDKYNRMKNEFPNINFAILDYNTLTDFYSSNHKGIPLFMPLSLPIMTCLHCGNKWPRRITIRPVKCPRCQSRKWDEAEGEDVKNENE